VSTQDNARASLFNDSNTEVLLDPAVHRDGSIKALVTDWGGVLTSSFEAAVTPWAAAEGIDLEVYFAIMRDWIRAEAGPAHAANPVHALERGELELVDFERLLLDELTVRTGEVHSGEGLFPRLFETFEDVHEMNDIVRRAHDQGIKTALLSNSWGNEYPWDLWQGMFDVVVVSGEVGMRKPERRIFEHTCGLLNLDPSKCVFIDDMKHNVEAAFEIGMAGLKHVHAATSRPVLERLLGVDLS
jgi:putative hydrolase of the HAD superfamily